MGHEIVLAVAGATGAVGTEMLRCLEQRGFPVKELRLLASERSAGRRLPFRGGEVPVELLRPQAFEGVDLALFSAGSSVSRNLAPEAARRGCTVVDNSSAFRMEDDVPLVVPEINAGDLGSHRGIVANPNCTTAVTLMALHPLHVAFGCTRLFASTYQAVSGSGARAIVELEEQTRAVLEGAPAAPEVYPHPIAFNLLPHVDSFEPDGYTREELKMENEARKILNQPRLKASVTCVRVPVFRSHSVAVSAEFEAPVSVEAAREALDRAPGIQVVDDPGSARYPLPLACSGTDDCAVGRLRVDRALDNGLAFWVCGDQLLKGAALNAVQIAEALHTREATS